MPGENTHTKLGEPLAFNDADWDLRQELNFMCCVVKTC